MLNKKRGETMKKHNLLKLLTLCSVLTAVPFTGNHHVVGQNVNYKMMESTENFVVSNMIYDDRLSWMPSDKNTTLTKDKFKLFKSVSLGDWGDVDVNNVIRPVYDGLCTFDLFFSHRIQGDLFDSNEFYARVKDESLKKEYYYAPLLRIDLTPILAAAGFTGPVKQYLYSSYDDVKVLCIYTRADGNYSIWEDANGLRVAQLDTTNNILYLNLKAYFQHEQDDYFDDTYDNNFGIRLQIDPNIISSGASQKLNDLVTNGFNFDKSVFKFDFLIPESSDLIFNSSGIAVGINPWAPSQEIDLHVDIDNLPTIEQVKSQVSAMDVFGVPVELTESDYAGYINDDGTLQDNPYIEFEAYDSYGNMSLLTVNIIGHNYRPTITFNGTENIIHVNYSQRTNESQILSLFEAKTWDDKQAILELSPSFDNSYIGKKTYKVSAIDPNNSNHKTTIDVVIDISQDVPPAYFFTDLIGSTSIDNPFSIAQLQNMILISKGLKSNEATVTIEDEEVVAKNMRRAGSYQVKYTINKLDGSSTSGVMQVNVESDKPEELSGWEKFCRWWKTYIFNPVGSFFSSIGHGIANFFICFFNWITGKGWHV